MKTTYLIWSFVAGIFIIPIGAFAIYQFYDRRFTSLPVFRIEVTVDGYKVSRTIPAFELMNQDRQTVGIKEWAEKIVIIDFFFTHCPFICPKMTESLKRVQAEFGQQGILINSFSIDPQRDNPARLKWYAQKFSINTGNWHLLTGDKKDIYKLARNGFMIVATDGDGGPEDFIHSEKLVLIDKQKRIRGYYNGTSDADINKLIQDIKKLKHE